MEEKTTINSSIIYFIHFLTHNELFFLILISCLALPFFVGGLTHTLCVSSFLACDIVLQYQPQPSLCCKFCAYMVPSDCQYLLQSCIVDSYDVIVSTSAASYDRFIQATFPFTRRESIRSTFRHQFLFVRVIEKDGGCVKNC